MNTVLAAYSFIYQLMIRLCLFNALFRSESVDVLHHVGLCEKPSWWWAVLWKCIRYNWRFVRFCQVTV